MRWVLTAGAAESNSLSALATLDMAGWAFGGGGGRGGANLSTRQWGRVRMIRRCGKDKAGTTHAEHWHVQEVTRGEEKDKRGARRRARSLAFGRRRYSLATCASLPPAGSAVDALLTCTSLILSIQTRARGPAVQRRVAPLPPVLSPPPSPHARHRALHGLSVPQHLKAPSAPPLNAAARLVAPGPVARSPSAGRPRSGSAHSASPRMALSKYDRGWRSHLRSVLARAMGSGLSADSSTDAHHGGPSAVPVPRSFAPLLSGRCVLCADDSAPGAYRRAAFAYGHRLLTAL